MEKQSVVCLANTFVAMIWGISSMLIFRFFIFAFLTLPLLGCSSSFDPSEIESFASAIDAENAPYPPMRRIHSSDEFLSMRHHLDSLLEVKYRESFQQSVTLSLMLWRASYLFGSDEQIAESFQIAMEHGRDMIGILAEDMATGTRQSLAAKVFFVNGVSESSLSFFVMLLSEHDPGHWGSRDYTSILETLVQQGADAFSNGQPIRDSSLWAAYSLIQWRSNKPIASRAMNLMISARDDQNSSLAELLLTRYSPKE